MGGCGVREVFLACMRRLLLNIKPWGRSFPYRSSFFWWKELVKSGTDPQTWDRLKQVMRSRFVPPSYKHDIRKKLQCLDQGSMSVQEYYQELQKGMLRCGVVEENEDKMVCFYGGLNRNIQDIIDYKEYDSIQRLFQLALLAEKKL
jgi:hypothetical protein